MHVRIHTIIRPTQESCNPFLRRTARLLFKIRPAEFVNVLGPVPINTCINTVAMFEFFYHYKNENIDGGHDIQS